MWSDSQGHKEVNVSDGEIRTHVPASQTRVLSIISHFLFVGNPAYGNKLPGSWTSCPHSAGTAGASSQVPSAKMSDLFLSLSSCRGNPREWKWVRNRLLWSRGFASPPWTWRVGSGEGKSQIAWNSLSGLSLDLASWGESGARREGLTWDLLEQRDAWASFPAEPGRAVSLPKHTFRNKESEAGRKR